MGSIEIYDATQRKWVHNVPDFKKWEQHFVDISEGRVRPDHKGRYIVGSWSRTHAQTKKLIDYLKVRTSNSHSTCRRDGKIWIKKEGRDYKR